MSYKQIIISIWVFFLLSCFIFGCFNSHIFNPQTIAEFLSQFKGTIFLIYFLISILRGLTLFPSTPLVLAGTILFPDETFLVLLISITGIIFSSTMIYYFSDYLGFGEYLEKKHSSQLAKITAQMQRRHGVWLVFFWSFIPFLPTDAICYIAGTIKMNFKRFLLAMSFGELIICSFYIFFGAFLLTK